MNTRTVSNVPSSLSLLQSSFSTVLQSSSYHLGEGFRQHEIDICTPTSQLHFISPTFLKTLQLKLCVNWKSFKSEEHRYDDGH